MENNKEENINDIIKINKNESETAIDIGKALATDYGSYSKDESKLISDAIAMLSSHKRKNIKQGRNIIRELIVSKMAKSAISQKAKLESLEYYTAELLAQSQISNKLERKQKITNAKSTVELVFINIREKIANIRYNIYEYIDNKMNKISEAEYWAKNKILTDKLYMLEYKYNHKFKLLLEQMNEMQTPESLYKIMNIYKKQVIESTFKTEPLVRANQRLNNKRQAKINGLITKFRYYKKNQLKIEIPSMSAIPDIFQTDDILANNFIKQHQRTMFTGDNKVALEAKNQISDIIENVHNQEINNWKNYYADCFDDSILQTDFLIKKKEQYEKMVKYLDDVQRHRQQILDNQFNLFINEYNRRKTSIGNVNG